MSELTVTIIKLAFLALLWLFIISAVAVMRADLFGTRVGRARDANVLVGAAPAGVAAPPQPKTKQPKQRATKPPKPRRGQPTQAVIVGGNGAGSAVRLANDTVTLGRGPECDLTIDDEYISTRHAVLRQHEGLWYAEDLGSTNGTFVDGARIHGPTEVRIGSLVRLGKTTLELRT
ncbi:MAG TPA: FHA domain-containing protein [Actinopolymorphaceae bacterium]